MSTTSTLMPAGQGLPQGAARPAPLLDPSTGRPAYTGPNGQPGYGGPQQGMPQLVHGQMPDGRDVWYDPAANPTQGNSQALANFYTSNPTAASGADQSANAIIQQFLQQFGLQSEASWVWQQIVQGTDANGIQLELQNRPAFKARFPAIAMRQAAGMPALSPAEYVAYEQQVAQLSKEAGIPQGAIDTTGLLAGDVSTAELGQRIQQGFEAAMQAPKAVRDELQNLYGIGPGDLTHFFLDPASGETAIMQKFRAAQDAGMAQQTGFGQLTQDQAEGLAAQGITQAQAQTGFTALGRQAELFMPLPGEGGAPIDKQTQLGAQFGGNAQDQLEIENRARQRVAAFAGGGAFAESAGKGITGLGAAQQQ